MVLAIAACATVPATATAQNAAPPAAGAQAEDREVVFEIGATAGWSKSEGVQPGGTFAFEVTPIEHWLELEAGVTAARANRTTETTFDVLFKKPWQISKHFEFMVGLGPEVGRASGVERGNFWGVSAVADFMMWPHGNVGWYVEPGYEVTFRGGTRRRGVAVAAGLLIGR